MKVPQVVSYVGGTVCKLNKAIYGLKQAARCWFEVFEQALKECDFVNSPVDRCIYILDKGDVRKNIYLFLYVDVLIIATADINQTKYFKEYVMNKFIGMRIKICNDKILLSQSAYIKKILHKFKMVMFANQ